MLSKWKKGESSESQETILKENIAFVGFQLLPSDHLPQAIKKKIKELKKPFQAKYLSCLDGDDSDSEEGETVG